jgi:hypothetical protein
MRKVCGLSKQESFRHTYTPKNIFNTYIYLIGGGITSIRHVLHEDMIPSGCDVPVGMGELVPVPGPDDFEVLIRTAITHIKLAIGVDHLVGERGIRIFEPKVHREEWPRDPGIHVDESLA